KELFTNVRQVVYQLSDQRQNIVTQTSPGRAGEGEVMFQLTRGLTLTPSTSQAAQQVALASPTSDKPDQKPASAPPVAAAPPAAAPSASVGKSLLPIRLAALDGNNDS